MTGFLALLALTSAPAWASAEGLAVAGRADGWLMAQAERVDTIRTKDGVTHVGRVLRENADGYLFREASGRSLVIPYSEIDDVEAASTAAPQDSPEALALRALIRELEVERDSVSFVPAVAGLVISVGMGVAALAFGGGLGVWLLVFAWDGLITSSMALVHAVVRWRSAALEAEGVSGRLRQIQR